MTAVRVKQESVRPFFTPRTLAEYLSISERMPLQTLQFEAQSAPAPRPRPGAWPTRLERDDMAKGICSIEGCGPTTRVTRGWCPAHYQRWLAHGDPLGGGPRLMRGAPATERFWTKVDKDGPVPGLRAAPRPLLALKKAHEERARNEEAGR